MGASKRERCSIGKETVRLYKQFKLVRPKEFDLTRRKMKVEELAAQVEMRARLREGSLISTKRTLQVTALNAQFILVAKVLIYIS